MKASEVCAHAAELVGGAREGEHGNKLSNFANIARLWDSYLACRAAGGPLNAADVGHMMVLMKIARTQTGSFNIDDYVDAAGYAGCAAQVAQELANA